MPIAPPKMSSVISSSTKVVQENPLPWHPRNYPRGLMYPPGTCLWEDNAPDDVVITVDGKIIDMVEEAQLGVFGHVVRVVQTGATVSRETRTGRVEAWRSALPEQVSSDTLVA